jgi:glutamate carboxypeptidase
LSEVKTLLSLDYISDIIYKNQYYLGSKMKRFSIKRKQIFYRLIVASIVAVIASIAISFSIGLLGSNASAQLAPEAAPPADTQSSFTPAARSVDNALLNAANAEQSATLTTLEQLVNIETGTGDTVGMPAMSQLLESKLKALGATVKRHQAVGNVVGENVVGQLKGKGGKNLLMIAHMDTVYERGTLAKTPFRIEDNKAYGPGIGDDKSGIAVILHSLRLLKQRRFENFGTITVLFNTDEEMGSLGSRDLIQSLASKSDAVFSYEPTLTDPEVMVLGTSGIGGVTVTIKGLAAHAGARPEQGVNALVEASDLVLRTLDLDRGEGGLRFNWTIANAGKVANIVPDEAILRGDVRYPTKAAFDTMVKDLNTRAAQKRLPKAEIAIDLNSGRPPFSADAGGRHLIQKAVDIYNALGHQITVIPVTGGGTDAGYASLSGKPVIEGLGLPGFGYHANVGEWVVVDAIPRRLYLSAQMIMDVAQGQ